MLEKCLAFSYYICEESFFNLRSVEWTQPETSTPSCVRRVEYVSVSSASLKTVGALPAISRRVFLLYMQLDLCAEAIPWFFFSFPTIVLCLDLSALLSSATRHFAWWTASWEIISPNALNFVINTLSCNWCAESSTLVSLVKVKASWSISEEFPKKKQLFSALEVVLPEHAHVKLERSRDPARLFLCFPFVCSSVLAWWC